MSSFWHVLFSSKMGRIVLDLTRLARYGLPRRHVTFAMSERKPAYPAHTQDTHEDEDEGPFAQPDKSVVSAGGDDQPLVQPASRREPAGGLPGGGIGEQLERNSPQLQLAPEACQSLVSDSGCVPRALEAILVACEAWLQHLGPHFAGAHTSPRFHHVL